MNERCPICSLRFEREQGYFIGSMYITYAFASIIIALATISLYSLFPHWSDITIFLAACGVLLPFVPPIIRYSRVIWMSFDRSFDPPGARPS